MVSDERQSTLNLYELARRNQNGLIVRLLWDQALDRVIIRYSDTLEDDAFAVVVPNAEAPRDAPPSQRLPAEPDRLRISPFGAHAANPSLLSAPPPKSASRVDESMSAKEVTVALDRRDGVATVLTVLVVLVFLATHEGWDVWLVGDSVRWATAVITVLGIATCALGSSGGSARMAVLAWIGVLAAILAVLALATGSLTALSLLVVSIVVLLAGSTFAHARGYGGRPVVT